MKLYDDYVTLTGSEAELLYMIQVLKGADGTLVDNLGFVIAGTFGGFSISPAEYSTLSELQRYLPELR